MVSYDIDSERKFNTSRRNQSKRGWEVEKGIWMNEWKGQGESNRGTEISPHEDIEREKHKELKNEGGETDWHRERKALGYHIDSLEDLPFLINFHAILSYFLLPFYLLLISTLSTVSYYISFSFNFYFPSYPSTYFPLTFNIFILVIFLNFISIPAIFDVFSFLN